MVYTNNKIDVKRTRSIHGISIKDIQIEIRNFLIDIYYEYERDGKPLKIAELSELMGISLSSTHDMLKLIFDKIKKHLNMLQ